MNKKLSFEKALARLEEIADSLESGELELPDAVEYTIDHFQQRYRVLACQEPVLDMSFRSDIEAVASRLADLEVQL